MEIKLVGKELKATEAIKDYVEKKMTRVEKYFEDASVSVTVTIKSEKTQQIAELVVNVGGEQYRTEVASKDLYASIDKGIDILEGQIRKWKTKRSKINKEETIRQKQEGAYGEDKGIEDEIIKTIYYEIKPMTPEDAKMKLQEDPVNRFFTFINLETNKVNVIYRLKDNKNYGLVEPEV